MILLEIPGITGDCEEKNHENWIVCESINVSVEREFSESGNRADRDLSNCKVEDIEVTKTTDKTSVDLLMEAACGKDKGKAKIHFLASAGAGDDNVTYLEYELDGAVISSFSLSSSGERPEETIKLNFQKLTMKYQQYNAGKAVGAAQGPKTYNIVERRLGS